MKVKYHKQFEKHYKKRIVFKKNLKNKFRQRLELRLKNPKVKILCNHRLVGKLSQYRSFWVSGGVRVVYKIEGKEMWLYDIGSHNQVY